MVKSPPGVTPKPRFGPNLDSLGRTGLPTTSSDAARWWQRMSVDIRYQCTIHKFETYGAFAETKNKTLTLAHVQTRLYT